MNKETKELILNKIQLILNEHELTAKDLVRVYSDLGINIGCSIEGIDEAPSVLDLERKYYSDPTMGNALILQSINLTTWLRDE